MDYHFVPIFALLLGFLVAVLARPKTCSHNGRIYTHGEQISLDNCTYLCTCNTATQTTAVFLCVPLCVRYIDRACPNGYMESYVMVQSGPPSSGCFCAVHNCIKSKNLSLQGKLQYETYQRKNVKVQSGSQLKGYITQHKAG